MPKSIRFRGKKNLAARLLECNVEKTEKSTDFWWIDRGVSRYTRNLDDSIFTRFKPFYEIL